MKIVFSYRDGIGSFVWDLPEEFAIVLTERSVTAQQILSELNEKRISDVKRSVADDIAVNIGKFLLAIMATYSAKGPKAVLAYFTLKSDIEMLLEHTENALER